MKKLILIRHGKASDPESDDKARTLTQKGAAQIAALGKKLLAAGHLPDIIYTSTAVRAQETTGILMREWEDRADIPMVQDSDILYGASTNDLLVLIRSIPDTYEKAALVGHNPVFEDLASVLSRKPVSMGTGNCAVFLCAGDSWAEFGHMPLISALFLSP